MSQGKSHQTKQEDTEEVYVISVAAELTGMHAQTLRTYDRLGLVVPKRTGGGGRRYSKRDMELLRKIQRLSHDDGVNLAGIKTIIKLSKENQDLNRLVQSLEAENRDLRTRLDHISQRQSGELVHVPRGSAVVMWERRKMKSRR